VGEDGKPIVYKKAKLGDSNKMYYNEEVRSHRRGRALALRAPATNLLTKDMPAAHGLGCLDVNADGTAAACGAPARCCPRFLRALLTRGTAPRCLPCSFASRSSRCGWSAARRRRRRPRRPNLLPRRRWWCLALRRAPTVPRLMPPAAQAACLQWQRHRRPQLRARLPGAHRICEAGCFKEQSAPSQGCRRQDPLWAQLLQPGSATHQ
jgi:hypothetical protein